MGLTDPAAEPPNPSTPSGAYLRMSPAWQVISDIQAGPATIRSKKEAYLPKYSAEGTSEYDRRVKVAPWQPEFTDILHTLASKPFGKDVALVDGASARVKELSEDIDGRGNNLTAFLRPVFRRGIAKGQHHILVDNTGRGAAKTVAEERAAGVRPYWVSIRAEDVLALYTAVIDGREVPVHVRLRECSVERDGYKEVEVERVRIMDRAELTTKAGEPKAWGPATWTVHRKTVEAGGKVTWTEEGKGQFSPLTEIPLASFWTGEREGSQYARPPLDDLADKQIELYRALSRQDEILTYAGSPMLCAQGIAAPKPTDAPLEVGPKRVLFAPAGVEGKQTGWSYIQPDAANLTEIRESVQALVDDIRRLGMQPLTQKSGGVTATASSIEGAKAHSTVEAWALGLKDVVEQAFVFTSQWLGEQPTVEVDVDTDFSVEPYSQAPLDALAKARAAGDLSRRTYWDGLRRFEVLSPDFDADEEDEALATEAPDPDTEEEIAGALTPPAKPAV